MVSSSPFRLGFVWGTAPDKWLTRAKEWLGQQPAAFQTQDPFAALSGGECDLALMRFPDPRVDAEVFHVVRLYQEQPGVAVNKDDELSLLDKVTEADLADSRKVGDARGEHPIDVGQVHQAVELTAANVGYTIAPLPLLRMINNKETAVRELVGESFSEIVLVWRKEDDSDTIQDFVGITRGRKSASSRNNSPSKKTSGQKPGRKEPVRKKSAQTKKAGQTQKGAKPQKPGARRKTGGKGAKRR